LVSLADMYVLYLLNMHYMVIHWQYEVANDIAKYSSCQAQKRAHPLSFITQSGQRYHLVSHVSRRLTLKLAATPHSNLQYIYIPSEAPHGNRINQYTISAIIRVETTNNSSAASLRLQQRKILIIMRAPTKTLLALLSTTSTIIPPVFAAVKDSTDTAADTTAVKGINWNSISSFFWQEDESFEADKSSTTVADEGTNVNRAEDSGNVSSFSWQEEESIITGDGTLRLSVSDSLLCKEEDIDIDFIERFLNTDEKHVGDFIQSDGKPDDQLACLVDEFKRDYGDDNDLTTRFILKELMSTNYLESCRDRGEDLDECSAIFPIVKEVVDIVLDSVIPILLEESSDECQYKYKKVFGEKYGPCLAADISFDNDLIDIILGIDLENDDGGDDEWESSIVRLFGLIVDRIGASLVLSDSLASCNGGQSRRRLVLPLILAAVKLGVVAAKAKAAVAVASKTGVVIQKGLATAAAAIVVTKQIENVQDKIKEEDYTKSPTRKPTQEPSKSPTQSPTSQPSIEPSTSQPSIEPSLSTNPSLSSQPSLNPSESNMPSSSTRPSSQPSSSPSDEPSGQPSSSKPSVGKLRTSKSSKKTKSKTGKVKCSKSKAGIGSQSFSNSKSSKKEGSQTGKAKASKGR